MRTFTECHIQNFTEKTFIGGTQTCENSGNSLPSKVSCYTYRIRLIIIWEWCTGITLIVSALEWCNHSTMYTAGFAGHRLSIIYFLCETTDHVILSYFLVHAGGFPFGESLFSTMFGGDPFGCKLIPELIGMFSQYATSMCMPIIISRQHPGMPHSPVMLL